jgi:predicted methyltransferase
VAPVGTADLVLFMRNIHAWMAAGIAEKAFADAWAALRPGGVLGVEQHRLSPDEDQDPSRGERIRPGSVRQTVGGGSGLRLRRASEINANERDTKDHPFGVGPCRRSA